MSAMRKLELLRTAKNLKLKLLSKIGELEGRRRRWRWRTHGGQILTRDAQNQANKGRTNPNDSWRIWTNPNKSWQIWTEPNKLGEPGKKRACLGKNRAKNGRNRAKKKAIKGKQNRTPAKQGETESFAKPRFGFAHPWPWLICGDAG